MAYENPQGPLTIQASTGLKQYQGVDINSSGLLINPTTSGRVIGVITSSGSDGSTRDSFQTVQIMGVAKVISGSSSIAIGDEITFDTDGRAIVGTTNYKAGRALAAGASTSTTSEIIPVLLGGIGQS